jgi:hypothetical protein
MMLSQDSFPRMRAPSDRGSLAMCFRWNNSTTPDVDKILAQSQCPENMRPCVKTLYLEYLAEPGRQHCLHRSRQLAEIVRPLARELSFIQLEPSSGICDGDRPAHYAVRVQPPDGGLIIDISHDQFHEYRCGPFIAQTQRYLSEMAGLGYRLVKYLNELT